MMPMQTSAADWKEEKLQIWNEAERTSLSIMVTIPTPEFAND